MSLQSTVLVITAETAKVKAVVKSAALPRKHKLEKVYTNKLMKRQAEPGLLSTDVLWYWTSGTVHLKYEYVL